MSLAQSSSPKHALDRPCINIVKAEQQPCNVTDDNNNQGPDCYESMHAFKKIRTSTSGLRKSPNKWTKEENQKLASLVSSYGEKKWKRISAEMGGQKTGAQCAQHWKRVLSPEIRKGHWDENEEDLLLRLVVQYGSCWKKIAKKIPQRTDIQCRYQYLKAKQSREVMWDNKEDESLMKKVLEMANCNLFQNISEGASSAHPAKGSSASYTSSPLSINSSNSSEGSSSANNSPSSLAGSPSAMSDSPVTSVPRFVSSPLRGSSSYITGSPSISRSARSLPDALSKENDDSESSGSGSSSERDDEYYRMKSSGEYGRDAWNDDKHNVHMSDIPSSTRSPTSSWKSNSGGIGKHVASLSESLCANCHGPFIAHINKVVWLEISEHMARLKLTSTLRTALECKTRFMELVGNKINFSSSNHFSSTESIKGTGLKTSGSTGKSEFGSPLRANGGMGIGNTDGKGFNSLSDNIGVKINNNKISNPSASGYNSNNINLTNCNNNNITINITNSYTTSNTLQNGVNFQQLTHCSNDNPSSNSAKNDHPIILPKPVLSPAPPFPSFAHLSFPHLPQPTTIHMKPGASRSVPNGLESLAAVASILPREMLADYF